MIEGIIALKGGFRLQSTILVRAGEPNTSVIYLESQGRVDDLVDDEKWFFSALKNAGLKYSVDYERIGD